MLYAKSLRKGNRGGSVADLQRRLNHQHFHCHPDGDFGGHTRLVVVRFQDIHGLRQDGVVGPATQNRLLRRGQVSPHFNIFNDVLYSKGNGNLICKGELIYRLERLRSALGGRILKCISVYRDPWHNRRVGGVWNSQHLYGKAADIVVYGKSPWQVRQMAYRVGFRFAYCKGSFTHVDVR
jgi:peptidoglycan hydrolase-like protein with peptidoglycan-binding domain